MFTAKMTNFQRIDCYKGIFLAVEGLNKELHRLKVFI